MVRGRKDIIVSETNYTNAICSCSYLYTYATDKEMKLKERLHKKFCKDPPVGEDRIVGSFGRGRRSLKAPRQNEIDKAKENKEFYED